MMVSGSFLGAWLSDSLLCAELSPCCWMASKPGSHIAQRAEESGGLLRRMKCGPTGQVPPQDRSRSALSDCLQDSSLWTEAFLLGSS